MCGVQSLALGWAHSKYVEHRGYRYIRIKEQSFIVIQNENYTVIVIRTNDEAIGIALAIPRTEAT